MFTTGRNWSSVDFIKTDCVSSRAVNKFVDVITVVVCELPYFIINRYGCCPATNLENVVLDFCAEKENSGKRSVEFRVVKVQRLHENRAPKNRHRLKGNDEDEASLMKHLLVVAREAGGGPRHLYPG